MNSIFGNLIVSYTVDDAIADGVFVDVDKLEIPLTGETGKDLREQLYNIPVVVTRRVFAECIEVHPAAEKMLNDIGGRLWDVLWMSHCGATGKIGKRGDTGCYFPLSVVLPHKRKAHEVTLRMVVQPRGPKDPSPVFTIMFPDED